VKCSRCPYVLLCMAGKLQSEVGAVIGSSITILLCRECARLQVTSYELIDVDPAPGSPPDNPLRVWQTEVAVAARRYLHCEKLDRAFLDIYDIPQVDVFNLDKLSSGALGEPIDPMSPGGTSHIKITKCEECKGAVPQAIGDKEVYAVEHLDEV
jgi:hypothetical protein